MKNRWIKWIGVAMCIVMLMLAFTISALAEESREEVSREHNVAFQSPQAGKDRSSRPDYLENNNQSGIWLPIGSYNVRLDFSDDDGICQMSLSDPKQETILVEEAFDITLTVKVEKNPVTDSGIIQPQSQNRKIDLDPIISESGTTSTEQDADSTTAAIEERMCAEELSSSKEAYNVLGLFIVLVLGVVILFTLVVHRQNSDEE